jgi:hypothetical protein
MRQLHIALLKLPAQSVTFRRKRVTQRNSLYRDVSFPLHFLRARVINAIVSLPPTNTMRTLAIIFL